jgi:hypothetical protein
MRIRSPLSVIGARMGKPAALAPRVGEPKHEYEPATVESLRAN